MADMEDNTPLHIAIQKGNASLRQRVLNASFLERVLKEYMIYFGDAGLAAK